MRRIETRTNLMSGVMRSFGIERRRMKEEEKEIKEKRKMKKKR